MEEEEEEEEEEEDRDETEYRGVIVTRTALGGSVWYQGLGCHGFGTRSGSLVRTKGAIDDMLDSATCTLVEEREEEERNGEEESNGDDEEDAHTPVPGRCPSGHPMRWYTPAPDDLNGTCDGPCHNPIGDQTAARCDRCDYDCCIACSPLDNAVMGGSIQTTGQDASLGAGGAKGGVGKACSGTSRDSV